MLKKYYDPKLIHKFAHQLISDLHEQGVINLNTMKLAYSVLKELPKGKIKVDALRTKAVPMIAMLAANMSDLVQPDVNPKAKCKTCNDQGQVRKVEKTTFGNVVNVVDCPKCRKPKSG